MTFRKTGKVYKKLINHLTEKPDPEVQILPDLFTYSGLQPNKCMKPGIIIRIHRELLSDFS